MERARGETDEEQEALKEGTASEEMALGYGGAG